MNTMESLVTMQVTMLILFLTGYLLMKAKVMTAQFRKALTDFIINFILPCNIVKSFLIPFDAGILRDCMAILLVSCGTQLFAMLLGRLLYARTPDGGSHCSTASRSPTRDSWAAPLWRSCTALRACSTRRCI